MYINHRRENELVEKYWQMIPRINPTESTRRTLNNYAVTHILITHGWQLLIDPPYIVAAISDDGKQFNFTAKYAHEFHYTIHRDIAYFFAHYGFPNDPVYRHHPV